MPTSIVNQARSSQGGRELQATIARNLAAPDRQQQLAIEWQKKALAAIPPVLFDDLKQAEAALEQATQQAQLASQCLEQHKASSPVTAAEVPDWSRRKALLTDEATGYAQLQADKQQRLEQAQKAIRLAVAAVLNTWRAEASEGLRITQLRVDKAVREAEKAFEDMRQKGQAMLDVARQALAAIPSEGQQMAGPAYIDSWLIDFKQRTGNK